MSTEVLQGTLDLMVLRTLARSPAFAVVAVAILAIGIAAATTIFSFVDAVLLKPLPYAHGDRIVRILERQPTGATSWFPTPAYLDWQATARCSMCFEEVARSRRRTQMYMVRNLSEDGIATLELACLTKSSGHLQIGSRVREPTILQSDA